MDLYDIGLEPSVITQQTLNRFPFENISHNILFAIAKAEWSLGFRSESVFSRVNQIIDNRENIAYYRSLGFSEQDIKEREEKLFSFQALLQTPPKAPRKRKISACNMIKRLPKGTVSYYEADDGYYGFVVLDAVYEGRLLALTEKLSVVPKNIEDVLNATALTAIWLLLRKVPKENHDIGIIKVQGGYNGRAGVYLCQPISFGINFSFYLDECHQRGLLHFKDHKVHDLLDENNVPIEFYCEETAKEETRMVIDLMNNPASKIATNMIRHAINLEGFFH
jgi:hypothetical protein